MHNRGNTQSGFGHLIDSTGNENNNYSQKFNIHFHFYNTSDSTLKKIARRIHGFFGNKHVAFDSPKEFLESDIQGLYIRECKD